MKKLTALLLALAMVFALAACGSGNASTPSDNAAPADSTPANETETPDDTAPEDAADVGDVANDPAVTLSVASSFTANELVGQYWNYFKEDVEALSGGSITLELYLGGTLCGADEELAMLTNGSIDLMMTFTPSNAFALPCISTIYYTPGSIEETQQVVNYLLFEDPDSSAVIADAFAANNATLLPAFVVTSEMVFASTQPITCWADLFEGKYGCPMDANYTDMGYKNLVTVLDPDWYESLRTGLCDSINPTAADVVNLRLYEVADYYLVCPATRVDNWMTINTDTYNSLTDNQRAVLEQACADLLAYTAEVQNDLNDQFVDVVESNGGTVINMTDEEFEWFLYCGDILGWQSGLDTLGVATDSVDALATVQAANREGMNLYTSFDFDELEAKYAG